MKRRQQQRHLKNAQSSSRPISTVSPYEQNFRPLPTVMVNPVTMPFYNPVPYYAPVSAMPCSCCNCNNNNYYPESKAQNDGNVFSQEAPSQPTFVQSTVPVPSVQLLQPSQSTSGQAQYNVIQPKPVMTYVFDNGPQYSSAMTPILPYAPQFQYQNVNNYHFQHGNAIPYGGVPPKYEQKQVYYQPLTWQYIFPQSQPPNISYMPYEGQEFPGYYYDPQEFVDTQNQQTEEEKANQQPNTEA